MENRLSDVALASSYDSGHQGLPWEAGRPGGFLAAVDFDEILAHPKAAEIIPSLPSQLLYFALKQKGLSESLEVLEHISQDQLIQMLDYDAWTKDQLVPKKAFQWLKLFGEISKEQLYTRYAHLDEETQIALVQGMVQVFDEEEKEQLSEAEQDQLYAMPCNTVFYRILSDDPEIISFIEQLIATCNEVNLRYSYSLLGHASYMPPNESAVQLAQFRRARLEEDGFVSYEDSQALFRPIDVDSLRAKWRNLSTSATKNAMTTVDAGSIPFLDRVLAAAQQEGWDMDRIYQVHVGLLHVANAFCTASQVEPDDIFALHRVMEQLKAFVATGLDYLAEGDVTKGLTILDQEHPKTLARLGLSLVADLRTQLLTRMNGLSIPHSERLERLNHGQRWGVILHDMDINLRPILGFEVTEILKGLFNRFPMVPNLDWEHFTHGQRITFQPISSLRRLQEMTAYVNGVAALMFLWARTPGQPFDMALEKAFATGVVNALGEGSFRVVPVTDEVLAGFANLDEDAFQARMQQLHQDLKDLLESNTSLWMLASGSIASDATQAISWALSLFDDMTAGLTLARQQSPDAVNQLVWSIANKKG